MVHPPEEEPGPDRNTTIRNRVLGGATLAEVAQEYGVTRQRVSQLMAGCPGWDGEKRRAARAAAAKAAAAAAAASKRLQTSQRAGGRSRTWTDTMILNALRAAAVAGAAPSAITWRYTGKHPSVTVIVTRFGSWNTACTAAGLHVHRAPYDRAATPDDELIGYVAEYLDAEPPTPKDRGGIRGYTRWARTNHAPGPGALRARFGSWSRAKALAVEQLTGRATVTAPTSLPSATNGAGHGSDTDEEDNGTHRGAVHGDRRRVPG